MRPKNSLIVAVVGIAALMLTFGLPTAAAHGFAAPIPAGASHHTIVVYPNGSNDTADIQAAFNTCTSHGWTCTVELVKGSYYTAQIAVSGFQGSFVGAGQGRTVIQALSNLPAPNPTYNTVSVPFWAGMPTGASGSNPWPDLFTFVGGTFSISGMTINEPYANPITSPGWYSPGIGYYTALYAVILVTGDEAANAAITQVTVNGAGGDYTIPVGTPSTFNLEDSIVYEGMLLPAGWTNSYFDQIPVSGTFSLTASVLSQSVSAFFFENLLNATVAVNFNSISSTPYPEFVDVSNSQLYFVGNSFTNIMLGGAVIGLQSLIKTNLLPSTVYMVGNYIAANWDGSGAGFFDFGGADGISATLNAVVTGNVIVSNMSCGCYTYEVSVVTLSYSLLSSVWSGNVIEGGGDGFLVNNSAAAPNNGPVTISGNTVLGANLGMAVYAANGVHITGNTVKNSGTYGIWVLGGSSDTLVAYNLVKGSALYDLYWDETGTGNVWKDNICTTSSPSGLC